MPYAKRQQDRIDQGLCRVCGEPRLGTAKTYCQTCIAKMGVQTKARRKRLRKDRLCEDCGQTPQDGMVHCQKCLAKRRIQRTYSKKQVPMGFCTVCRHKKCLKVLVNAKLYMRYCQECYLRHAAASQFSSAKLWTILLDKLEAQQWQCVYSGDKITLGLNDSMDHIIPKSIRPDLIKDPSNIQWVTRIINKIKHNLTHDEFVAMIEQMYNYCCHK